MSHWLFIYFLRLEILAPDDDILCGRISLSVASTMKPRKYIYTPLS